MTTGTGRYMNPRHGDVVKLTVEVAGGRIATRDYTFSGCDALPGVMREVVAMSDGHMAEDVARIEAHDVIERLRLGPDDERCALTAIAALRAAIVDARVKDLA